MLACHWEKFDSVWCKFALISLNCQIWNNGYHRLLESQTNKLQKLGIHCELAKYDAEWAEYVAEWAESEFNGNSCSFRLGLVGGLLISK